MVQTRSKKITHDFKYRLNSDVCVEIKH